MATGYYLLDHATKIPQCGHPRRSGATASGTIILHDAEGGTDLSGEDMGAENVANYIRTRDSYGSYHDLVDRDTHIPMAPIDYETWHSAPDNPWSVGISVAWNKADLARMTIAQRRSYYVPLARVVLLRRAEFAKRGIKVPIDRFLTATETRARKPGISTHSRTDPTRRSDPFGTGSKYETEFLAVLAELAKNPNTTVQEDDMFTDSDRTLLDQLHSKLTRKEADGNQPPGDVVELQRRDLIVSRRTEGYVKTLVATNRAQSAAIETLAHSVGIDPNLVVAAVEKAVRESLPETVTIPLEG